MSEKTEALRLAEELEWQTHWKDHAAELRRLSIENEALGLHLSERMKDLARVEAQRDALLGALKNVMYWDNGKSEWEDARAAIKAVEEQK